MSDPFVEGDSKAGFYHDLSFLFCLVFGIFLLLTFTSGYFFSIEVSEIALIFLSVVMFLNLQEFVEVKVPRYGWKCSKLNYKLASAFLLVGVLLVSIVGSVLNSGIARELPILFFLSIGFLLIPIVGIALTLDCYLDFARSLGVSLWRRDEGTAEVLSKHSFFHRKFFRRKR